ncbi:MAG: hypothetical protein ACIARR_00080, partial [Phycisphaerales bacterium JB059]
MSRKIALLPGLTLISLAHAAPPIEVALKTGDVINERTVLSFDLDDALGLQWAYAPMGPDALWAGVHMQGPADTEPQRAFAIRAGSEDGSILPESIYAAQLDPDQTLVSFMPRHTGPNAIHFATAYTRNADETFARSTAFIAQVGQPTRALTPLELDGLDGPAPTPRLQISSVVRVPDDAGFVVEFVYPYVRDYGAAGGNADETLVLNDDAPHNPSNLFDPAMHPDLGFFYRDARDEGVFQIAPPFVGDPPVLLMDRHTVLPQRFGASISLSEGPIGFALSQSGVIVAYVSVDSDNGLLVGDFTSGFEFTPLENLFNGDPRIDEDSPFRALAALAPNGSLTIPGQVSEDHLVHDRCVLIRPALPPTGREQSNTPRPGLADDLRVTHTHWHRISDYGAVLMALRLAPESDLDASFDAIVARYPSGQFEILAREGEAIPGLDPALGAVTAIDTAALGNPSERTLTESG